MVKIFPISRFSCVACALLFWGLASTVVTENDSFGYEYSTREVKGGQFKWEQVIIRMKNDSNWLHYHNLQLKTLNRNLGVSPSAAVNMPVYVSLTAISTRINAVNNTVISILRGSIRPNKIFLFISREGYLIDHGIREIPQGLLALAAAKLLTIVYTQNIGPHRKLLPLLDRYRRSNCLIVTLDDDLGTISRSNHIYQLLRSYVQSNGSSVVALRARRFGLCNSEPFEPTRYRMWMLYLSHPGRREMLLLPTGTGGVLYHPSFFHPVIFDSRFRAVTGTADDLMFRLACMARNVSVVIACQDLTYGKRLVRKCPASMSFFDQIHNRKDKDKEKEKEKEKVEPVDNSLLLTLAREELLGAGIESDAEGYGQEEGNWEDDEDDEEEEGRGSRKLTRTIHSLYDINRVGRNDVQWVTAVVYLRRRKVLDVQAFVNRHHGEREPYCYNSSRRVSWECALVRCYRKSRKVTGSNSSSVKRLG